VDAVWINPISNAGGAAAAVRTGVLLSSIDPFAVDYYSAIYVLLPHLATSTRQSKADPRQRGSNLRDQLMINENRARGLGMDDMIDLDDRLTPEQETAQFNAFVVDVDESPSVTLSLTASPGSQIVLPGETARYAVSVTVTGGPAQPVALTLAGQPSGAQVHFAPNPVGPPGASQLTIATTSLTAPRAYPLTLTGTTDSAAASQLLDLSVRSATGEVPSITYLPFLAGR
jgi:hypothetical protein